MPRAREEISLRVRFLVKVRAERAVDKYNLGTDPLPVLEGNLKVPALVGGT